jgi:hypothetical protein
MYARVSRVTDVVTLAEINQVGPVNMVGTLFGGVPAMTGVPELDAPVIALFELESSKEHQN